jgi:hypothetical protein
METAKSRSAWPFIVAGNGFGMARAVRDQHKGMPVGACIRIFCLRQQLCHLKSKRQGNKDEFKKTQ